MGRSSGSAPAERLSKTKSASVPSVWITSVLELVKPLNHVARPRPHKRNGVSGAHFQSACGHNGNAGRSASPGRCQVPICPPRCLRSKKSSHPFCLCSESPEPPIRTLTSERYQSSGTTSDLFVQQKAEFKILLSVLHLSPFYRDASKPKPDSSSVLFPLGEGGWVAKGLE